MSWMGWFCVALTAGYLITNHVVLPLYTRPLDYYWNQWYGAEGIILVDEAKVSDHRNTTSAFADLGKVLSWCRHNQLVRRYLHLDCPHLERCSIATCEDAEDRDLANFPAWKFVREPYIRDISLTVEMNTIS